MELASKYNQHQAHLQQVICLSHYQESLMALWPIMFTVKHHLAGELGLHMHCLLSFYSLQSFNYWQYNKRSIINNKYLCVYLVRYDCLPLILCAWVFSSITRHWKSLIFSLILMFLPFSFGASPNRRNPSVLCFVLHFSLIFPFPSLFKQFVFEIINISWSKVSFLDVLYLSLSFAWYIFPLTIST